MSINEWLILAVICTAGITDVRTGKIYNKLTYPAILLGFLLPFGAGEVSLTDAFIGFLIGFVPLFVVHQVGGIGGGDVKLIGAIGAIGGYPFVLHAVFYSFFLGGLLALMLIIWQGRFIGVVGDLLRTLYSALFLRTRLEVSNAGHKIPFGFVICLGTLWAIALELLQLELI